MRTWTSSGTSLFLLLFPIVAGGVCEELTEARALEILRQSSSVAGRQANDLGSIRDRSEQAPYPDLSLHASFEGAGRTEFYFVEKEIALGRRRSLAQEFRELEIDSEQSVTEFETAQVEARMLLAFYRLVYAQDRLAAVEDNIREHLEIGRDVEAQLGEGSVSRLALFRYERSLAELRVALSEVRIEAARARHLLAQLLAYQVPPETLRAKGSLQLAGEIVPLREALAAALPGRGDLRAATTRMELSRLEVSAAKGGTGPNVTVHAGIKRADLGDRVAAGPYLAVSVPVPLRNRRRLQDRAALKTRDLRQEQLRLLRNQVRADVRQAHDSLRLRRASAEDYRGAVWSDAQQLRESAIASYRTRGSTVLEVLDSVEAAQGAQLRLLELQTAAKLAEVELRAAIGARVR